MLLDMNAPGKQEEDNAAMYTPKTSKMRMTYMLNA